MSATNDPTIEIMDNSDLDVSATPLRDPIIDKVWVRCRISELYWEGEPDPANPGKKRAKNLWIGLVTDEPAMANNGSTLPAGHRPPKFNIYCIPTGGLRQDMIDKKIARFQIAALGLDVDPANPKLPAGTKFGPPDQYIGRAIKAYFEAESKGDATYQRVGRWDRA